jgi:hypothetical protein
MGCTANVCNDDANEVIEIGARRPPTVRIIPCQTERQCIKIDLLQLFVLLFDRLRACLAYRRQPLPRLRIEVAGVNEYG